MDQPRKLVFNIERLAPQSIAAHDAHERTRSPDGWSKIDPARSHLNKVLHGPASPAEGVAGILKAAAPPHGSCTRPYFRILLSASPEYFVGGPLPPDGQPKPPPRPDRVNEFCSRSMAWLKDTFGERDLAHVALHLDETTPHLHVLIVPTYDKAARVPKKPRRGEDPAAFAERQAAAKEAPGKRTVSPSSHPAMVAGIKAFPLLRKSCADVLALDYGQKLDPDASPKTTRKWLQEQAKKAEEEAAAAAADRRAATEARTAAEAEHRNALEESRAAATDRAAAKEQLRLARLQTDRIHRHLALADEIADLPPGDQDPTPARLAAGHHLAHHLADRPTRPPLDAWRSGLRTISAAVKQAPRQWHLVAIWDALRAVTQATLKVASLETAGTAGDPERSLSAAMTKESDYAELVDATRHRSPHRTRRVLDLLRPVVAAPDGKKPSGPEPGLSRGLHG